jgi:GTPase SAR1 family protein
MYSSPEIKVFLIGNKSDLTENRKVSFEEGVKFQQETKIDHFVETSAKYAQNTTQAFEKCAKLLYNEYYKLKNMFGSGSEHGSSASSETNNSNYSFKLKKPLRESSEKIKESEDIVDPKKKSSGCSC